MELDNYSVIIARRLKQLREDAGLSHDRLSKALFERYSIKISSDSLMNYEVADKYHTKARKNLGMSVKYLYCLSDFYGVSADWLLGLSNERTLNGDLAQACRYTGLSANSISKFHELSESAQKYQKSLLLIELILRNLADDFGTLALETEN